MSIRTPPPGGDGGARPPAGPSPFTPGGGVAGASGVTPATSVAPPTPAGSRTLSPAAAALVKPGALDGPGALRVLMEEIRAVVQTQLRAADAPPLPAPESAADAGNAAAALLRWLRTVAADTGVPLARVRDAVETGYARASTALASAPASGSERLVRETLAAARDVVLRGIANPAAAVARSAATPADPRAARDAGVTAGAGAGAGATYAPGAARPAEAAARVDPITRESRATPPRGTTLASEATAANANRAAARRTVEAAAADEPAARAGVEARLPAASASPARANAAELVRSLAAAVRSSPGDPAGALRRFAEELTAGAGARAGPWLPPAELDVVDPGASLLRWARTAGALPGTSPESLRAAVEGAHARALERVAAGPAERALRDVVGLARDLLLREFDGADAPPRPTGTLPALVAPAAEPHANPAALRPELVIGGPPRGGGARRAASRGRADDRVDPVDAEERRREWPGADAAADAPQDPPDEPRAMSDVDLQGPMDCIRRYFDAFHADDSAAYAAQWVYPACFWSGGRWSAYADEAACAAGNAAYVREARAQGMTGGRIVMLRVEPLAPGVAIVHGVFTRERADGSVLAEVEAAYTTVQTAAGWKVAVCVVK